MPAKIADDGVAAGLGMALDGVGDVAEAVAGLRLLEAEHEALVGDVDQLARLEADVADQKHAAGVAMPAIDDRRDVDVDDVAVLQLPVLRNAMADDMIDRGAAALGIAAIAEGRRDRACASMCSRTMSSSSPVVTPGTTCGTSASRISAASRPALRMPSKPSGPCSLIWPLRASTRSSAPTVIYSVIVSYIGEASRICTRHRSKLALNLQRFSAYGRGMADEKVWTAALLVIGDEILSGRTQDKNVAQVAEWLNRQGIRLEEVRVVPDVQGRIAEAVNALRTTYDYLLTTGGIGPTHDDITVDSIAAAFGVPVVVHPHARQILEDYYATRGGVTGARLRMARVPEGAELIPNPTSGAPGVKIGNVYIMAGVPSIAGAMLAALDGKLEGGRPVVSSTVGASHPKAKLRTSFARPRKLMPASRSEAIRSSRTASMARTSSSAPITASWSTGPRKPWSNASRTPE